MEQLRTNPPLPTFTQLAYAVRRASLGLRGAVPETYECVLSACALLLAGTQGRVECKGFFFGGPFWLSYLASVLRLQSPHLKVHGAATLGHGGLHGILGFAGEGVAREI